MKNITYLIGAGASVGCLPIVDGIPDRISNLIEFLSQEEFVLDESCFDVWKNQSKRSIQELLISDLNWLHTECLKHASIDTLAKKLWLTKKYRELGHLKMALSVFFILEQFRFSFDKRYDTFYASILKNNIQFPDNLRILSWNYDFQFEIAFREYSNDSRVINNSQFPIISKFSKHDLTSSTFALFKLNGTASFIRDGLEYTYFNYFSNECNKEIVEEIIRNFAAGTNHLNRLNSSLSFGWETDIEDQPTILSKAITACRNTQVLVVIGYSFPFFNREIDRELINSMKDLEKVYIQAPDAIDLAERFEAVRDMINPPKIVPWKEVKQFLLPNEL